MSHPNSERFHSLLLECGEMHDRKQADYGKGDDPFANVRSSSEWGVPAWVGAMVRLNDKVKRLQSLANGSPLQNEGAYDSFIDIAVYALIAYVLFEQDHPAQWAEWDSNVDVEAADELFADAWDEAVEQRADELCPPNQAFVLNEDWFYENAFDAQPARPEHFRDEAPDIKGRDIR